MIRRTGKERVVEVETKRPESAPSITIAGGPAPMTTALAEIIRRMVARQRDREQG